MYSFLRIFLLISCTLPVLASCGGSGGGPPTITTSDVQISWDASPETAVNRAGGGYKVFYSNGSGFNPGDGGVTEVDVPYSVGVTAPTSVVIALDTGTYYIRIAAYSALNAPGTTAGSMSTATPEITLIAP